MIIQYLKLKNFRPFYGEQRVDFAGAGQKNVTLIFGANGAGKTTLLNAFTWALFDAFTPGFENPTKLLNERALEETQPGQWVDVEANVCFEHDGRTYDVFRSQRIEREASGVLREGAPRGRVVIQFRDDADTRENVVDIVGQILPKELHQFFFFDGERIEKLVQPEGAKELDRAIKTILGLEVLERALLHIPQAKKIIRENMRKADAGESLVQLIGRAEQLETELAGLRQNQQQCRSNRDGAEAQRAEAERLLREHAVARERQLRLDQLRQSERVLYAQQEATRKRTRAVLSERSFVAFAKDMLNTVSDGLEDLRMKGKVPSPYDKQFVDDLLAAATCVCGTALPEGSEARSRVLTMLVAAGRKDLQSSWTRLAGEAEELRLSRPRIKVALEAVIVEMNEIQSQIQIVGSDIDALEREQRGSGDAAIADFAARRDELSDRLRELDRQLALLDRDVDLKEAESLEAGKRLQLAQTNDSRTQALQRQLSSADRIDAAIASILAIRRNRTREQLDERIKKMYESIAYKDYVPELTSEFHLRLTKSVGGRSDVAVNKSQGENQLLALSFVGALALLARERFDERSKAGKETLSSFEGGVYPVVMDSPFGALDENYRRETARAIPQLAPQVVTMVSKSQGIGVVQEELRGRIGRAYVIVYETPKANSKEEEIVVNGRSEQYIVHSDSGFEMARIVPVPADVA